MRQVFPRCLIAALTSRRRGLLALDAGFVTAETLQKLSGTQIRAKFAGMQLTDEVHYRLVYERMPSRLDLLWGGSNARFRSR